MPSHAELAAGPDPLILLVLALLLDAYIGDPPGLYRVAPHPVELMGRVIGALERRLPNRSCLRDHLAPLHQLSDRRALQLEL